MKKYKLLSLVALCLAATLAFCACSPAGSTTKKAPSANGTWGENVTWDYDSSSKTLTFSGAGDMSAMTSPDDIPWADAYTSAERLVVKSGITSICDYAFYGFSALVSAELPEGLSSIGKFSFAFCGSLESISIPSSLTAVGDSAFEWCASLKSINLGSSITSLGSRAFAYCRALEGAYICSEGLSIKAQAFHECDKLTTLTLHPSVKETVNAEAFDEDFDISKIAYALDANEEITITVSFVYSDGAKAAEAKTITAKLGDAYAVTAPEIEGFTADLAKIEGVAGSEDMAYTVTYTAIPADTETETEPVETAPAEEKEPLGVFPIIILVVVLGGVGVGAYFLIKSNKKEAERQATQNKAKNRKQK